MCITKVMITKECWLFEDFTGNELRHEESSTRCLVVYSQGCLLQLQLTSGCKQCSNTKKEVCTDTHWFINSLYQFTGWWQSKVNLNVTIYIMMNALTLALLYLLTGQTDKTQIVLMVERSGSKVCKFAKHR